MKTIGRLLSRYGDLRDKWVHVDYQSNTDNLSVSTSSNGANIEEHPEANWSRLTVS